MLLLFSLILVIVPMVIFPKRLGMPLISGSAIYMFYELVYYGLVLYLFRRQTRLVTIVIGAALTLVYRMALGAAFGLTVVVMYAMDSTIAFSLGMGKYLPAVLLHVAVAPFVMRAIYLGLSENLVPEKKTRMQYNRPMPAFTPSDMETTTPLPTKTKEVPVPPTGIALRTEPDNSTPANSGDENQFERAVNYIGESASVKIALVVDSEGLPLAQFSRSNEDVELWAPLAIVLERGNQRLLNQYNLNDNPEKIDIGTGNMRIILRRIEKVTLMILTEQNADETILIRIAQAADMIRKYVSERYSPALFARVEERYVSNS